MKLQSFPLNCLRKSLIVYCWREWFELERTCLLAASAETETEDTWVFFIKQLVGLKANTFCRNKRQWMYYAMLEIRVSLFTEHQYKFPCALFSWVTWQCGGSCQNYDIFVLQLHICTGECNGTELSVTIIWRVNQLPLKYMLFFCRQSS